MLEDMVSVARNIVVLVVFMGGWSVAACAPPTPKVEPSIAVQTIQREFLEPVRDQDGLFRRVVSGAGWSL